MAKRGTPKNGKNKALHTKLLKRKKDKLRDDKQLRADKLKAILKATQDKDTTSA
ncbi:hypothetical protein [Leeuwenhoekiella sp. NPDC079379]|uniref:hypothetical protein n=1 Tax=Leeuwenhoekiella sp. NPDC079379 TaxID=3364122 RepID=UPI0027795AE3|nr:hypothetical protein [Leeuwenhoekiella sp.]